MIRILAETTEGTCLKDIRLDHLEQHDIKSLWLDLNQPNEEEVNVLADYFHFHPLAIEDCLHALQRPKLEYYDQHNFLVMHAIDPETLEAKEINAFIGENFIVTFHFSDLIEVEQAWEKFNTSTSTLLKPMDVLQQLMDKLVDAYFPILYHLEDRLGKIETDTYEKSMEVMINEVFDIRGNLLKLRQSIVPMRDLLYRVLESRRFLMEDDKEERAYFQNVYDHLLKLSNMIQSNREISSDYRDSYISLNSYRMNNIIKTLTVITTIFMPLTFIAGIYGMNFEYMPELRWKYGYFLVLGLMFGIGIGMYISFRKRGWFKKD
ncbi:magnesium/cobalt transporter CorA [Alkalihalobacillus sp. AL-G]|uniref:magnesium/cobalt transporter CorA n=1 Tax=Alkalihalobacillus sp. AL-G TaxID=2926399 RepID=UPI00272BFEE2|nr:magnesium/cobalt transporter CorA [Alkalihalobacillus sp. AL-G]WLD91651.1 magnesium/cobalt transporter CorA [Alkalihalobacillus sp. AL-G]